MDALSDLLVHLVQELGYIGIFVALFVESSFIPIPSEVTMIPAGILAAQGKMNYWLILLSGTLGVVGGSLFTYWLGATFGRAVVTRYGKYVWIRQRHIEKTEYFFARYGAFAAFVGRLLPGLRHYIAFIAGIAKMKKWTFLAYTSLGGMIWIWILLQVGYMAQVSKEKGDTDINGMEVAMIAVVAISVAAYFLQRWMMNRIHHHPHPTLIADKHEQPVINEDESPK